MSALDQAIVKAYGKVAQPGRPVAEPISAPVAAGAKAKGTSRPEVAKLPPKKFAGSPEVLYRPEWISPSQTSSVVPSPHIDFRLVSAGAAKEKPAAVRIDPPVVSKAAVEKPTPLRAAFEVNSFVWPEIVQQMADAQEAAFAPLLAELGELSGRGKKLVAISGCRAGAGATTLLLALAKLLGQREVSTAVVDLEFWNPRLAEQLGVAPLTGWSDVLRGQQPLTEAMIESMQDRMTLVPLGKTITADKAPDAAELSNLLHTLSRDFDLVLLNVGLEAHRSPHIHVPAFDVIAWLGRMQIDFALLVRDARSTRSEEALALGQRMTSAGVKQWHLAENYTSTTQSASEPVNLPLAAAAPSTAPIRSTPNNPLPPVTSATTQTVRPVPVSSISQSHAADWQSSVVPPWKS